MALTGYELVAAMGTSVRTTTEDSAPFGPHEVEHYACGCSASKWSLADGGWTVATDFDCQRHCEMRRRGELAGTALNDDELGKRLERKRNRKRRR